MDEQLQAASVFEYEDIFGADPDAEARIEEMLAAFTPTDARPKKLFTPEADGPQRAFIESTAETIRLLAPAGSGKTQSIAGRCIADGADPNRMLLLTCDNAARSTLASRIAEVVQSFGGTKVPSVQTLNSFGNGLLKNELREAVPMLHLGTNLEYEQRKIVGEALKQLKKKAPEAKSLLPGNLSSRVYVQVFSLLKNEILIPEELLTQAGRERFLRFVENAPVFRPWLDPLAADGDGAAKANSSEYSRISLQELLRDDARTASDGL
jgi:superfamily I DNA/RNA helicase